MSSLPNLHPFFVHFPVALFTTAVACDAALVAGVRRAWLDRAAVLLHVVSALSAGGAALTGKLAADAMAATLGAETSEAVALHGDWAFFSVVVLFVAAAVRVESRWRDRAEAVPRPHRTRLVALVIAITSLGVLLHTANRGGELVYRYGVGVELDDDIRFGGERQ